jgi:hypothetical protein
MPDIGAKPHGHGSDGPQGGPRDLRAPRHSRSGARQANRDLTRAEAIQLPINVSCLNPTAEEAAAGVACGDGAQYGVGLADPALKNY